ncbi:hypothetical protein BDV59DRAFT_167014 [Aspergillus ambiguus]|uniref:uncharacterized protein n=1 Tax=Aspergillus ambiguus TaxID=176160 RepID=UPI003CCDEBCD
MRSMFVPSPGAEAEESNIQTSESRFRRQCATDEQRLEQGYLQAWDCWFVRLLNRTDSFAANPETSSAPIRPSKIQYIGQSDRWMFCRGCPRTAQHGTRPSRRQQRESPGSLWHGTNTNRPTRKTALCSTVSEWTLPIYRRWNVVRKVFMEALFALR